MPSSATSASATTARIWPRSPRAPRIRSPSDAPDGRAASKTRLCSQVRSGFGASHHPNGGSVAHSGIPWCAENWFQEWRGVRRSRITCGLVVGRSARVCGSRGRPTTRPAVTLGSLKEPSEPRGFAGAESRLSKGFQPDLRAGIHSRSLRALRARTRLLKPVLSGRPQRVMAERPAARAAGDGQPDELVLGGVHVWIGRRVREHASDLGGRQAARIGGEQSGQRGHR